ncbi:MAG: hypothetical protein K0S32_3527 [Bacteroidetes bacterium]|nr:hypothetical protein [Bacteroidota bacterium]
MRGKRRSPNKALVTEVPISGKKPKGRIDKMKANMMLSDTKKILPVNIGLWVRYRGTKKFYVTCVF